MWFRKAKAFFVGEKAQPQPESIPVIVPTPDAKRQFWAHLYGKRIVVMPDGRLGVVWVTKGDRRLGVRPIDIKAEAFYPNTSLHWEWADRVRIPEEHALTESEIRDATAEELKRVNPVY